ncbi:MAG TPA: alpha/beta hydrolase [Clostridia bacterium]|nr:alpha/beta hydrolase [Clostridia bacterium]
MNNDEINDKYIQIDNYRVRYRALGEGSTTVMMIHGIGGYIEGWADVPAIISKHFKVVVPDMVGHGLSDKPSINYSIDMFTDFIIKFMEALNIEKAALVGHSLGGAICLDLSIKYPDKVKTLILVNSAGTIIPFGIRAGSLSILQRINLKVPRSMLKAFNRNAVYDGNLLTEEWLDEVDKFCNTKESYRVMFSVINSNIGFFGLKREIRDRFCNNLTEVKIPVLIICAADDRTVPKANSYHLHSLIPDSKLIRYEKCRHLLPYEYTEKLAADIEEFLATNC